MRGCAGTLAAYVLVTRDRYVLGGFAAGLSVVLREEGYVMIAALTIALLITRRRGVIPFVSGSLSILVPIWLVNLTLFAHPLGLHAKVYASLGGPQLSNWWVYLFELTRWPRTMRDTLYTQGFFAAVPLAAAAFFSRLRDHLLLTTIVAGIVLTPLALTQTHFGIIWGPRHFLWLIPLVAVAAGPALRQSRAIVVITLLLIAAGVALQIQGLALLRTKLRFSDSLMRVAAAPHKPIVTDVFWIPEDLAALHGERRILLVSRDEEIPRGPLVFVGVRNDRVVDGQPLRGRILERTRIAVGNDPTLDAMVLDCR